MSCIFLLASIVVVLAQTYDGVPCNSGTECPWDCDLSTRRCVSAVGKDLCFAELVSLGTRNACRKSPSTTALNQYYTFKDHRAQALETQNVGGAVWYKYRFMNVDCWSVFGFYNGVAHYKTCLDVAPFVQPTPAPTAAPTAAPTVAYTPQPTPPPPPPVTQPPTPPPTTIATGPACETFSSNCKTCVSQFVPLETTARCKYCPVTKSCTDLTVACGGSLKTVEQCAATTLPTTPPPTMLLTSVATSTGTKGQACYASEACCTESGQKKTKGAPCVATKLSECVMTNGVCDGVESGCRAQFVADGTPCNNNAGLCDDGICITADRCTAKARAEHDKCKTTCTDGQDALICQCDAGGKATDDCWKQLRVAAFEAQTGADWDQYQRDCPTFCSCSCVDAPLTIVASSSAASFAIVAVSVVTTLALCF